jgi:hypothetical protein
MYLFPLLLIALIAVAFSILQQSRKDRWLKEGRCRHCGYDLRASTGRCPECGRVIPSEKPDEEQGGLFDDIFATQPIEPRKPSAEERMVEVARTTSVIEANFLATLFEHRGIAALVEGQPRPTDYQPPSMRLMVWSEDREPAAALLEEVAKRQAARRAEESDTP